MKEMTEDEIRSRVRARYGEIGKNSQQGCCCSGSSSCCGSENVADDVSLTMGYSSEELSSVPEDANLGLGCGNPQAIASLGLGEIVLDLGCGGGFDVFLAAKKVGSEGHVIGVDMTPEMISRARANAAKGNYQNVEFRLGEIENLPVNDAHIDVIISNCVINLSPNKQRVFDEAFRALKTGGRIAFNDIMAIENLPVGIQKDEDLYAGCISGAIGVKEFVRMLEQSGFVNIQIEIKKNSDEIVGDWMPGFPLARYIASAIIKADKPMD